jgi:RNA polymerase sigma-70 factor, ECF subfamily
MSMDRTRINALLNEASSGDDAAFGALACAAQDELFRLALAHGLCREDAAEATQEVLLRAYSGKSTWKGGSDAMAWLCGIALNVVRECRRRQRRRTAAWEAAIGRDGPGEADADGDVGETGWDPDQLRKLREAIDRLPPRQREAVACRYLRRMSVRQTAEAMGCAAGTVKSAVSAALERLRAVLEKQR